MSSKGPTTHVLPEDTRCSMTRILEEVDAEQGRSFAQHGPMNTTMEGLAVLREEYLEWEEEVFHGGRKHQITEALQIAAMAVKYIHCFADDVMLEIAAAEREAKFQRKMERLRKESRG